MVEPDSLGPCPEPALVSLPERELVDAVLRKDRKATADFIARHSDAVYSFLARRLMPRQDAVEDLFQQVFLEAWQRLATWQAHAPLRHWLLGIARHKVQDYYRAAWRLAQFPEEGPEPESPAGYDEWLDEQASSARVRQVLEGLPEHYRMVLICRYWEQFSTEEIARLAGKSVKAVERALARARDHFRRGWTGEA